MRSYPKSPQRSKTTPQQAEARGFDTMRMLEILARPRIAAALESDGADVRLVGRWIWTEFESRPSNRTRSFLRAIGFKWNSKRKLWQHCCGVRSVRSVRSVPRHFPRR